LLLLEGEKANFHCFEEKTRNIIQKELVASICIVGVTEGMDISRDSIVIRELLKNAQELSEQLGYSRSFS
jgi:hypothetical protein